MQALSVRSDFSLGDSLLHIDHIVEEAQRLKLSVVATTDTMNINGFSDLSAQCKKLGIKTILGCRVRVVADPKLRKLEDKALNKPYYLKVYAKTELGAQSLMKLLSRGNTAENFYYVPRVGLEDVLALEDCIVTTGDFHSPISVHRKNPSMLTDILDALQMEFNGDFYVELPMINTPLFDRLNATALELIDGGGHNYVPSYPALYREGQAESAITLKAIMSNDKVSSRWVNRQHIQDFTIKSEVEFKDSLKDMLRRQVTHHAGSIKSQNKAKALASSCDKLKEIADKCTYEFKKMKPSLPVMAVDEWETLRQKCLIGWKNRLLKPVLGYQPAKADLAKYSERVKYELDILKKMGFSGYFLLVEDIVVNAKKNGIMVGPARGSCAGSLVAYLIGMTDVDPIRFGLIFERFINPSRLDLPDADLDFMSSRREEVFNYLRLKYGEEYVAGISNYTTLGTSSSIRDVSRVNDLNPFDYECSKLVPKTHGSSASLDDSEKEVAEISAFAKKYPDIWRIAKDLEGNQRGTSQHAAGMIVAGEPLINRAVVLSKDVAMPVVNWDKRVVEDWGLVKMDILGLSTLDVLKIAQDFIRDNHGIEVDYLDINLGEDDVMEMFAKGDTKGVFQFESHGMSKLLKSLAENGPLTFDDITAATALYRPGPMDSGLMDDFVEIKNDRRVATYEDPKMEPLLRDTYGVFVYQEQVMFLAQEIAGFTMTEADSLRKAIGKKDAKMMAEQRDKFVQGCIDHSGTASNKAVQLFDKIEKFAAYSFNKSHAAAYTIISYWTMWLKKHYPAEYFAAGMTILGDDKIPGLIKDAEASGISIMPPDINKSGAQYKIDGGKTIYAPFFAVKGVSEKTAIKIVEMRDAMPGGRFDTAEDFRKAAKQKGSGVNVRVVENLDLVGSLASIDPTAKSALHFDRRRDQTILLPTMPSLPVKADRTTDGRDSYIKKRVIEVVQDYRKCEGCDLAGQPHPCVRMGANIKFMVVSDCPTWEEEKEGKFLAGTTGNLLRQAILDAGLAVSEGYYTSLVKGKKDGKFLSNDQINGCKQFIDSELELIKPAVIVTLGYAATKRFAPNLTESPANSIGMVVFDPVADASVVIGFNPYQIIHDPSKLDELNEVFRKVAEIVN